MEKNKEGRLYRTIAVGPGYLSVFACLLSVDGNLKKVRAECTDGWTGHPPVGKEAFSMLETKGKKRAPSKSISKEFELIRLWKTQCTSAMIADGVNKFYLQSTM